ncbi:hypothetical protein Tco_0287866 [Tanacetum coccineum]
MWSSLSPHYLLPFGDSDSLVEETDILLSHFNDSSPDYKTFCFNVEEKSSGSITSLFDLSLLEYKLFLFDLSTDPFPPADRSDFYHEEFADELAHIISPPEYDHFYSALRLIPSWEILLWMGWKIFSQQENPEFMCLMF